MAPARESVTEAFNKLIKSQLFLNLFQYAYALLPIVLPSAIIASRVLSGELEVGSAVRAAGAFAAGIDRLNTFSRVLASQPAGRGAEA